MQVDCPRCGASNYINEAGADDAGKVRTACKDCSARLLIKVNRPDLKVNPGIPETSEGAEAGPAAERISVLDAGFEIDLGAEATSDAVPSPAWLAVVVQDISDRGVADLRSALMGVRRFRANPNKLHDATSDLPFIFDQLTDADEASLRKALQGAGATWDSGPRSAMLDSHGNVRVEEPLATPSELVVSGDEDDELMLGGEDDGDELMLGGEADGDELMLGDDGDPVADEPMATPPAPEVPDADEDLASALAAAIAATESVDLAEPLIEPIQAPSPEDEADISQAVFVDDFEVDDDVADAVFAAADQASASLPPLPPAPPAPVTPRPAPPPPPAPVPRPPPLPDPESATLYRQPKLPSVDPVRLDRPVLLTGLPQLEGRIRPLQLVTASILVRPDARTGRVTAIAVEKALADVLLKLEQAARSVGANLVLGVSTSHGPTGGAPGADLLIVAQGTAASRD